MSYEKNRNFLVIPKSPKVGKKKIKNMTILLSKRLSTPVEDSVSCLGPGNCQFGNILSLCIVLSLSEEIMMVSPRH